MASETNGNVCKVKKYISGNKLIIVSNREPYYHEKSKGKITAKRSIGGLISALDPVMQACDGTWISWGSGPNDFQVTDENGRVRIEQEGGSYTLRRLKLSEIEKENYYQGFSNRILWPISHYFADKMWWNTTYWKAYMKVNEKFSVAILDEYDNDAWIWVHDYHLSLVPGFVRKEKPHAKIAFFWHIVWPSPEVFQRLPWRKEILKGLLGNDMIGFHTKNHADNFMKCVEKLTPSKVDWEENQIKLNDGRTVRVEVLPIGIDYDNFVNLSQSNNVRKIASRLKKKLNMHEYSVIFGVDRLDYTKGVLHRLRAFEKFLDKYPKFRKKLIFVQVVTPSRSKVVDYRSMKKQIDENVGRINGKLQRAGWVPINNYYRVFSDELLVSYYNIADVAMVTPLADGMNLVAKEFIAANKGTGVLILSEFAGAADTLKKSLIVNPYDIEEVADSIKTALEMTEEEKKKRMEVLKENVNHYDVYWWLDMFFRKWRNAYV